MNKQQAAMIKLTQGNKKTQVELALRFSRENNNEVYLPNVYDKVEQYMSAHEFAGYLSALTKEGKYKAFDRDFGEVMINKK